MELRIGRPQSDEARDVYETCIVTFVDILGFREIVAKRPDHDISAMLSLLRKTTEISETVQEKPEVDYYAFSDSIVRVRRISESVVETIGVEANDIGLAQLDRKRCASTTSVSDGMDFRATSPSQWNLGNGGR